MTMITSIILLALLMHPAKEYSHWPNKCPLRAEFITAPVGHNEIAIRKTFGTPVGVQEFILAKGMNPYRRSLRTLYPAARFDRLPIRELGWTQGDCRLMIWFVRRGGAWTAVQALRSNAAGEF